MWNRLVHLVNKPTSEKETNTSCIPEVVNWGYFFNVVCILCMYACMYAMYIYITYQSINCLSILIYLSSNIYLSIYYIYPVTYHLSIWCVSICYSCLLISEGTSFLPCINFFDSLYSWVNFLSYHTTYVFQPLFSLEKCYFSFISIL